MGEVFKFITIVLYIIGFGIWADNYKNADKVKSLETMTTYYKRATICLEIMIIVEIINLILI